MKRVNPHAVGLFFGSLLATVLGVVLVTAAVGYLAGYGVGMIWNRYRPRAAT